MKKIILLFLLVLIVGSIDAQSFEKVTDYTYFAYGPGGAGAQGYKLLSGTKNMLINGFDMTSINGVKSPNGVYFFDGKNFTAGFVGDDKCCGEFQVDSRASVYGSLWTGIYRVVFGKYGYAKTAEHQLDSGFVAIAIGEQEINFTKTNLCYSSIFDSTYEEGTIEDGVDLSPTKIFLGGRSSTVNGYSCPYAFIYDIATKEVDTLGGREVENGPNGPVIQTILSPDGSKVVCLANPQDGSGWHLMSYNLETKLWSKEKEPVNVFGTHIWYHRGLMYMSANFINLDTSCHSNVQNQWAKQNKNGEWEFVCLKNSTNDTWSSADVRGAMDILPDSTLFVAMSHSSVYQDWNKTLYPLGVIGNNVHNAGYSIDTFQGNMYVLGLREFSKIVGQILPLTWTSFTAEPVKNQVWLKWSVSDVINNDRFEVERSPDGQHFTRIGTVYDNGNLTYQFTDNSAGYGTLYYRIRQVDKDGKSSYSATRVVNLSASAVEEKLQVFPNPAQNQIRLSEDAILLQIFSAVGKPLKTINNYNKGEIIDISGLNNGMYYIRTKDGKSVKVVVIK